MYTEYDFYDHYAKKYDMQGISFDDFMEQEETPLRAVDFAIDVIGGRFKALEDFIAKDAEAGLKYTKQFFDGRWSIAERAIFQDAEFATEYAIDVVGHPVPEAEETIKKYPYFWDVYCDYFADNKSSVRRWHWMNTVIAILALVVAIIALWSTFSRAHAYGDTGRSGVSFSRCINACDREYRPYTHRHMGCVTLCYRRAERDGGFDRGCFNQARCENSMRRNRIRNRNRWDRR